MTEALNETAFGKGLVARGKHYLIFGSQTSQQPTLKGRERLLQNRVLVSNWLFFDDVSSISYDDWTKRYTNIVSSSTRPIFINLLLLSLSLYPQHSAIGLSLPQNIYLMSFEPWKDASYLIRFEHIVERDEDSQLSAPARFNLLDVFPGFDIDLKEVSLSANQWIEDFQRLHFIKESVGFLDEIETAKKPPTVSPELDITLNPMEIKTFIITLSPKV